MDKIQAAIAKARAARDAAASESPASPPALGPATQTPAAQTSQTSVPVAPSAGAVPDPAPVAPATPAQPSVSEPGSAPPPNSTTGPASNVDRPEVWKPLATFAPSARQMAKARVVSFATGKQVQPGAVAFDMLRTKVLQQMRANGWTRLAITSPGADCGKSTVALNLAFSLSKQADVHTIVAEMDMRRPSLAKTLGIKGSTSFASVIGGTATFADMAVRPRPNLAMGLNFARARNPAELLQSPTIGPALAGIEATYAPDLTIFDMPPMLVSDDALAFMGQVDCVLMVAAAGSSSLREIDVCERDLAAQTNVMGVILNKCRYMEKDYGYGYGGYN